MWWLLLLGLGSALASASKPAPAPVDPNKADNGQIVWAIIITLGFSTIFTAIYVSVGKVDAINWLWVMPLCWFLHVLVGRVITAIVEGLCNAIDGIYGLADGSRWGQWTVGGRLIFASLWPLTGGIMLPVSFIGVLFGLMFKAVF